MADESEGIDIKLSEEDSPADILRESEDISLFADDHGTGEASAAADLKLDDDFPNSEDGDLKLRMDEIGDLADSDMSQLRVSKDAIIETVCEAVLSEQKPVAVVDKNDKVVGALHCSKVIHMLFGTK